MDLVDEDEDKDDDGVIFACFDLTDKHFTPFDDAGAGVAIAESMSARRELISFSSSSSSLWSKWEVTERVDGWQVGRATIRDDDEDDGGGACALVFWFCCVFCMVTLFLVVAFSS